MTVVAKFMIGLIKLYQRLLSPFFGQQCRFCPTCSQYAIEVFQKHGALKAFFYTVKRLLKCHPWHVGGHDPVP